jgi:hypothetical protein
MGGGAGHIAISLGRGQMITTTRGAGAITRIRGFADHAYLGWMPPYFRSIKGAVQTGASAIGELAGVAVVAAPRGPSEPVNNHHGHSSPS